MLRGVPTAGGVEHVASGTPVTGPSVGEHAPLDRVDDLLVEEDEVLPPPPEPTAHRGVTHKRYRGTSGPTTEGRGRGAV